MLGRLMVTRRFAPLFWCQFFSAFNDNFVRNVLVILVLFKIGGDNAAALATIAGAVLIAPFFILSGLAGQMADRYDKAIVARALKLAEIAVAAVAAAGFLLDSIPVLFVALGGLGIIGALFGPIKYGVLPDHLSREELPSGNALIESGTFLAILTGTIAGGIAAKVSQPAVVAATAMVVALLCWATSLLIPRTGEAAPTLTIDQNIARSTIELLQHLWADTRSWRGGLMVGWFWLTGAVALSLLPTLVKDVIGGTEEVVTAFLAIFSVAIAIGSVLASWLAAGRIILLPAPVAALLMGAFAIDLSVAAFGAVQALPALGVEAFFNRPPGLRLAIDLAGLAIAGGLFIVPSFAAVQAWAGADHRARVVAAVNVLSAAFVVGGTSLTASLQAIGVGVPALWLLLGSANLVAAVVIFATLPTSAFRDLLSIVFRTFYRLEAVGLENVAKAGPHAVIAVNHVSFLDGLLILSLLDRPPVFAVDHAIAQKWWARPFIKAMRAMPLDPTKPMATRTLINAVKAGETLVIFPEGRITVTGALMKVYDGAGLIAEKTGAMVVPVRIEGLEATAFSRLSASQARKRWFPKVTVTALEPVKLAVDAELKGRYRRQAAGASLYGIMSDLIFRTTSTNRSIIEALIEAARIHGRARVALEDPISGALTYRRLLVGTRLLGRKLIALAGEGRAVGVMLPNANSTAVTILGLMSAGRVPAMINFTAGAANILAGCKAAEIKTIVTSRGFVEKGRLAAMVESLGKTVAVVYLEDIRSSIGLVDRLRATLAPARPIVARGADDPAIILFTSGSEGTPKGVVLSNRNILANAAQAAARIDFGRPDKVFNVLPLFHSFGLTIGLVLPLTAGVRVYLYPSPLHYRLIPELIYGVNATVLFGTDTFLAGYARSAHPYDFRSLRYVLAGAEPVKEATRRVFMEKFGLRILEGYGVTETAPALAINTPMFNRFGTVGRLLPGIEARLRQIAGVAGGRLEVRGPNVMLGYLKATNPGAIEPPTDGEGNQGWHDTGDIVSIDTDGFVTIKGRAKRFAKIGGEMVSLAAVEALVAELWPNALSAVVALPDQRKGERLVVATTQPKAKRAALRTHVKAREASDLMVPAEVVVVPSMPLLGSGKVDHVGVKRLVEEALAAEAPPKAPAADGASPAADERAA